MSLKVTDGKVFLNLLRSRAVLELTHNRIEGHARSRDAERPPPSPRVKGIAWAMFNSVMLSDNLGRRRRPVELVGHPSPTPAHAGGWPGDWRHLIQSRSSFSNAGLSDAIP